MIIVRYLGYTLTEIYPFVIEIEIAVFGTAGELVEVYPKWLKRAKFPGLLTVR